MKIGVILGGISSEREVSLKSGEGVFKNLKRDKYDVEKIIIDKKEDALNIGNIDFAFVALHGKFGEDGAVQTILEAKNIPYSGCNPLTSGILMDKNYTKTIARYNNIKTADWIVVKNLDEINYEKIEKMGYPVFIKPNSGGSSVATFLIKKKEDVQHAVAEGLKYDDTVMIESYVKGTEYTSFILDGEVYPTIVITSENEFFDFEAKYSSEKGAEEKVVTLHEPLQTTINEASKACWNAFNCKAYVRVDFIVTDNDEAYLLELNTLPGMTETSLIPQSAAANGLNYSNLLDKLIEASMK